VPKIKLLPVNLRPRERMLSAGEKALSDVELVAVVLGGDLERADAIVSRCGNASDLVHRGVAELCDVPGVGLARACQIQAAIELGRRALTGPLLRGMPLRNSEEAAARLADLNSLENEELHVLALDSRHRVLVRFVAARGALNAVHVSPRDVLRRLVRESAAAMIVAHNHPSGDHTPSIEDHDLTRRLHAAGELVGVSLIDHLVIGRHGYHSFAEEIRRYGKPDPS
jgi:DNA repair protein RadC